MEFNVVYDCEIHAECHTYVLIGMLARRSHASPPIPSLYAVREVAYTCAIENLLSSSYVDFPSGVDLLLSMVRTSRSLR
jgi:hypothetical protein